MGGFPFRLSIAEVIVNAFEALARIVHDVIVLKLENEPTLICSYVAFGHHDISCILIDQAWSAQSWTTYNNANEQVGFCNHTPTPTVSSNVTFSNGSYNYNPSTGIIWAIERPNADNYGPTSQYDCKGSVIAKTRLHALCATTASQAGSPCYNTSGELIELYNSDQNVINTPIGPFVQFSTPAVFNGNVYMGTQTEVNVFGLCPSGGCPLN